MAQVQLAFNRYWPRPVHETAGVAYRPDIDGLRAVAVLSVLAFHGGLPFFTGGFIGVDVFFVISGFLITRIIAGDLERGRFTVANFYERRIRRIFPALYATIVLTLVGTALLYTSVDRAMVFETAAWLAIFASNFYFADHSGYFDATADQNPFLQTWSLAIEEQYYVVFPLLFALVARRWPKAVKWTLLGFAILSFVLSVLWVGRDPRPTFFSTPARVWELLIGALLAIGFFRETTRENLRVIVAAVGALMIVGSLFLLSPDIPFPGALALPACAGTAAIIWAGSNGTTVVHRTLSHRVMVGIGLISYSLYLLHWPLITFARYWAERHLSIFEAIVVLLFSGVLAALCWRYVEVPFRERNKRVARAELFAGTFALIAVLGGAGLLVSNLTLDNLSVAEREVQEILMKAEREPCMVRDGQTLGDLPLECTAVSGPAGKIAMWGDSYAVQYFPALTALEKASGRGLLLVSAASCPPIAGLDLPSRQYCSRFNTDVLHLLEREKPSLVILSAHWLAHEKKRGYQEYFVDKFALLTATIDKVRAAGAKVLVIGPSPVFPAPVPRIAAGAGDAPTATAKANHSRVYDEYFLKLAGEGKIAYFATFKLFCGDGDFCTYRRDGKLLFRDDGHLTDDGAAFVLDAVARATPDLALAGVNEAVP